MGCSSSAAGEAFIGGVRLVVHIESNTEEARNMNTSHPVNFFRTSAVDVPNSESLVSPPKEAPSPELLLSCIKIVIQRTTARIIKSMIAKK